MSIFFGKKKRGTVVKIVEEWTGKNIFGMRCNIFFELWAGNIFWGGVVNIFVVEIVHFFFGGVIDWGVTKYIFGRWQNFFFQA